MHETFKRTLLSHVQGRLLKSCRTYGTYCNAETKTTQNIYRRGFMRDVLAAGNDFWLFIYTRRHCIDVSELVMLCSAALFFFFFFFFFLGGNRQYLCLKDPGNVGT